MLGILITGHGNFATGLKSSIELIAGASDHFRYVDFPGDSTDKLTEDQNKAFDELSHCDGVLVLADLVGGSPFKSAAECKFARPDQKIEVVGGSNLPMMIEAATTADLYEDPIDLADSLIETGKEFIIRFELEEHVDNIDDEGGI